MKKVVVAGANGLVGRVLISVLVARGYHVIALVRSVGKSSSVFPSGVTTLPWNSSGGVAANLSLVNVFNESAGVVNLAGASVSEGRWTTRRKQILESSRIGSTNTLCEIISATATKPMCLISASGVGYYGDGGEALLNEDSPSGSGFLAQLCRSWEDSALLANTQTRVVILRIGIVLAKNGGALKPMVLQTRLFAGGTMGRGNNWWSWIHIQDLLSIILLSIESPNMSGIFNAVSPEPSNQREFSRTLCETLNRPSFLQIPDWVMRLLLGEKAQIVLFGQRVSSKKLQDLGFTFQWVSVRNALENLLR